MSGQELPALQAIEHFIGQKIPRLKLENFPYIYTALFESESATSGRRESAAAELIVDIPLAGAAEDIQRHPALSSWWLCYPCRLVSYANWPAKRPAKAC